MGIRTWLALAAVAAGLLTQAAAAQTLARRNWAGSGITVTAWWRGAEFYAIDPLTFQDSDGDGFGDLNGITARLGYLESLGVEAIVLTPFELNAGEQTPAKSGTEQDFARLVGEATRSRMRILVDVPVDAETPIPRTLAVARYWLTRGAAGIWLSSSFGRPAPGPGQRAELRQTLDALCATFAGQRVALFSTPADPNPAGPNPAVSNPADSNPAGPEHTFRVSRRRPLRRAAAPQPAGLTLDARLAQANVLTPALLRQAVALPQTALLATDADASARRSIARLGPDHARLAAAALLLGQATPVLLYGQELGMGLAAAAMPAPMQWGGAAPFTTGQPWIEYGPNAATANVETEESDPASLLSWYRRLGALRLGEPALHGGPLQLLTATPPEIVAWQRRGSRQGHGAPGRTLVIVGNLSARAVFTALPGTGSLKVLAASWMLDEAVPVSGAGLVVPAGGVLIAEVRRGPGLESVVLPPRRPR